MIEDVMRKMFLVSLLLLVATPSYAWYDSYGGFTCGYLDPLTSFLDDIFGPPCPPPVAVAVPVPVPVAPVPVGDPFMNPYGAICQPMSDGGLVCQ